MSKRASQEFEEFELRPPDSSREWLHYYDLRWRILREPWGQVRGSERDDLDRTAWHLGYWGGDGKTLAIGRLHANSDDEGQIRYMAVEVGWSGHGFGRIILQGLENQAVKTGLGIIVLNAREESRGFYSRCGYVEIGPAATLFGTVNHIQMQKTLESLPEQYNSIVT